MSGVIIHPEYQQLQQKYAAVMEHLSKLICFYDDMVLQQGPQIEAQYVQAFGELDTQAYEAYVKVATLKRQIDLVQAYLNRGEAPDTKVIERTLSKELKSYEQELERMVDKLAWSKSMIQAEHLSREDSVQLKKMYHDLAKGLHPDLNPQQTETERGFWFKAQKAYEDGDLMKMQTLYEIFQAQKPEHADEGKTDALTELQQKQERASVKVDEYLGKIQVLGQEYPFKFEELLDDSDAIGQRQSELQAQIDGYVEQVKALNQYLELLLAPKNEVLQ